MCPIEGTPITPVEETPLEFPALVTLAEAASYFSTRMNSEEWDYASEADKQKAIYSATRAFNALSYRGTLVDADQDNKFPTNEDGTPDKVKWACCEEALSLISGMNNEKDLTDLHVKSSSMAGFSTTVNELLDRPWVHYGLTSPIAWRWLSPYLLDPRSFYIARA